MALRFKLDENLPREAEAVFRAAGHDTHSALAEGLAGAPDPRVFDACQGEQRILVTFDLDFADIRLYPPETHVGIWILRPAIQSITGTTQLLRRAIELLNSESAAQRLWIVGPDRVRIRD